MQQRQGWATAAPACFKQPAPFKLAFNDVDVMSMRAGTPETLELRPRALPAWTRSTARQDLAAAAASPSHISLLPAGPGSRSAPFRSLP